MLNDFEVAVTMLKFLMGIGIFNRPILWMRAGFYYAIIIELMGCLMNLFTT